MLPKMMLHQYIRWLALGLCVLLLLAAAVFAISIN